MRPLPSAIARLVRPMPATFAPVLEDRGRFLRWSETLVVNGASVAVELGFHRCGKGDHAGAVHLRAAAWQAIELARLGRFDLLNHCRVDRHRARPRL